ncbi:hypothetical protein HYDPIDRAFT_41638 [Hydnomerulius pinastri MD-312]|uniref:Uncharacterized protein n=1 Tax=Hydnomerulius pinastri MD-312 TaxID=994086 RepID=A0A0C9WDE2_9AGAM|nr:hypothetical protein HYDPIDRAFT_41638 [Hydnomerulius pinastri MD-312]
MSSTELADARNAISRVSRGKDVNEDSWMTMWCNANWGDLLQPAPLSIALLGSLMVIASSTDDFSLLSAENTNVKLLYTKYPTSFKTCLQQMVGEGYTAFETASHEMTRIHNASSQLPAVIKTSVMIIMNGVSPVEVETLLPIQLEAVTELAEICMDASQSCEKAFTRLSGLAQEILECATFRVGTAEQNIRRNETHLAILEQEKRQEEQMLKEARDVTDLMKKSFGEAEEEFKTAVNNIPSGWDIVGMHAVESLTNLINSAGNAFLGMANVKGHFSQAAGLEVDVGYLGSGTPATNSTQPNGPALSDPAVTRAQRVLQLVSALSLLISGGPGGKPDWDRIRGTNDQSGGLFVEASLERIRDRLDKTKPISAKLLPTLEQALRITKAVNKISGTFQSSDDKICDTYKPQIKNMIRSLEGIVTQCNLILQQPGSVPTGPATPRTVSTSSSVAKAAIETAKFQVDQTRANLEAARGSYDKASARLIEGQKEITRTITSMTSLSLENATLKDILPVLMKALKSFTTLRAQFSQLTQFFRNVASLIKDVMRPQVSLWTKNMEANSKMILAGVTLSDWVRQAMYQQMMIPLKVSMLSERIAQTYLRVSDLYIMPAQREVGHMLQFQEDTSEQGRVAFAVKLSQAQTKLQEKSEIASQKILQLVAEDQKKFALAVNQRLDSIQSTLGRALPAINEPIPRQITDVTEAHVEEFDRQKEAVENAVPMYDIDDLM